MSRIVVYLVLLLISSTHLTGCRGSEEDSLLNRIKSRVDKGGSKVKPKPERKVLLPEVEESAPLESPVARDADLNTFGFDESKRRAFEDFGVDSQGQSVESDPQGRNYGQAYGNFISRRQLAPPSAPGDEDVRRDLARRPFMDKIQGNRRPLLGE